MAKIQSAANTFTSAQETDDAQTSAVSILLFPGLVAALLVARAEAAHPPATVGASPALQQQEAAQTSHPLNPFSGEELSQTVALLQQEGLLTP